MEKKKRLVLIVIIIVLIISMLLVAILFPKKNTNPSKTENNSTELTEKRAEELVKASYLYYMFSSGNFIKNGEKTMIEDEEYYGIDTIIKLESLADIDKIMNDTFTEEIKPALYKNIYEQEERILTYVDGNLYTNKINDNPNCNIKKEDLKNYTIEKEGEYYIIQFMQVTDSGINYSRVPVIFENGKWLLTNDSLISCE